MGDTDVHNESTASNLYITFTVFTTRINSYFTP